eukprot:gene6294-biopygen3992
MMSSVRRVTCSPKSKHSITADTEWKKRKIVFVMMLRTCCFPSSAVVSVLFISSTSSMMVRLRNVAAHSKSRLTESLVYEVFSSGAARFS